VAVPELQSRFESKAANVKLMRTHSSVEAPLIGRDAIAAAAELL
jgi:hypothetical protein